MGLVMSQLLLLLLLSQLLLLLSRLELFVPCEVRLHLLCCLMHQLLTCGLCSLQLPYSAEVDSLRSA